MTKLKQTTTKGKRVVVGLSGGVDSAVSAALLLQGGFEVVAVYMKNWNTESPTLGNRYTLASDQYRLECPWYDDYLSAKRVALHLGIPFELWDFRQAYKEKVFDEFLAEIERGRTPNPDIYCNSRLKFADFLTKAVDELKADYVATGHYARIVGGDDGPLRLAAAADTHKDQSYFLYRLNQDQLARTIFPLSQLTKDEVRRLADELGLPNRHRADSQGICFVGDVDLRQFVGQWLAPKEGEIVDPSGAVIGRHEGVHLYTIGQKVAVDHRLVGRLQPELRQAMPHFYVSAKDVATNRLTAVAGHDNPALLAEGVVLESVVGALEGRGLVRLRHTGDLIEAEVKDGLVRFDRPERAVAPGQHAVIYDAVGVVLGGGVISEVVAAQRS